MTTQIGERFWSYYKDGVYPCTCFFCKADIKEKSPRWHSRLPVSVYSCNGCFDGNRILPGLYPETHQERIVVEKAVEVPVTAKKPDWGIGSPPDGDYAPTARETRISTAHDENMESARQTRSMLSCLVSAIVDLTRAVEAMNE